MLYSIVTNTRPTESTKQLQFSHTYAEKKGTELGILCPGI